MKLKKQPFLFYCVIAAGLFFIVACNNNNPDKGTAKTISEDVLHAALLPQNQSQYHLGDTLKLSLQLLKDYKADSIQILFDDTTIAHAKSDLTAHINTKNLALGKHTVSAILFVNGKFENLSNTIYLLADAPPKVYDYRIINAYPHDTTAFTEGLEYSDGYLYESTGEYGQSELRKIELTTGKVLKKISLDKQYFGEGLTKFKNNFIQLTWRENTGFVYDLNFNLIKTFSLEGFEGWGLSNNGEALLKSDGTNKIYFLHPETFKQQKHIEVYDNQLPVRKINELEYINESIYANVWETNAIIIINPKNGKVEGTINLAGILNMYEKRSNLDVLNGIAYDQKGKRLFVTGKNWPRLFEIKLIPK